MGDDEGRDRRDGMTVAAPSSFSRRTALAGVGALALASCEPLAELITATPSPALRDIAAAKGMRFGTAVNAASSGSRRGALAASESSILVAENEFKFGSVHKHGVAFDFEPADKVAAYAADHDIALRGHSLFWNQPKYVPAWLANYPFGAAPAVALEGLLGAHIQAMLEHFRAVRSWDVVNETVQPETGSMRDTVATRILGDRLLDVTFAASRRTSPAAQLVYNDYMHWGPDGDAHRRGVLALLEGMKARSVPCDALGIQGHIAVPGGDVGSELVASQKIWRDFLQEVHDLGYGMLVTEFDIDDRRAPSDIGRRDRIVADTARAFLDVTLDQPGVRDILCWGLDNGSSWLQRFVPRSDGLPQRGCPFDSDLRPTPLRAAITGAIRSARVRS
ncbi:endo-1,4-beta-xylanase [Sphingosinicellaceae bacterium]|nr:endo-1,4-beta-xylanase [Sphingosinicellaceae bacterium]